MRLNLVIALLGLLAEIAALHAADRDELSQLRAAGAQALRNEDWTQAERIFQSGLAESRRLRRPKDEGRFLSNLGSLYFLSFRSADALSSYAAARRLGLDSQDRDLEQVATVNMTMVYARYAQWDQALATLDSLRAQPWSASKIHRSQYLQHRAIYLSRLTRYSEADEAFRVALDYASSIDNQPEIGRIWENWGISFLARHQPDPAEHCFLESFRSRYLRRNPEYHRLFLQFAQLALERGDAESAVAYSRRALEASRQGRSNYPGWNVHHTAARALQRAGQIPAALDQFRQGLAHARRTRADALPLDQIVISTENSLFALYADFLDCAFPLAQRDPRLMAELWAVSEENRRASLRLSSLAPQDWETRFPAAYRESLAKLQRLESRALSSPPARAALDALRLELWTQEGTLGIRPGLESNTPALDLRHLQSRLPSDEALVSFHVGDRASYSWLITRDGFQATALPRRAELAALVSSFRHELSAGLTPSSAHFRKILGEFFPVLATKPYWTVIVDGPLFELPLPALPLPDGQGLVADRFAVAFSPGVPSFGSRPISSRPDLVAFADPVYNRADSRRASFQNASYPAADLELPRLTGTARETQAVAAAWPGPKRLHLGPEATRTRLLDTLRESPGVLHLATHVIAPSANPPDARLALSLTPGSAELEQLGPQDLLNLRHRVGLVVMTGCASGRGKAVPGAGLVGLSRAWLVSGAEGVLASLWPMPDDSGELATAFYRHLRRLERGPPHRQWARALQSAQREMRQSSGWRSQAPYWASYFLLMRSERSGL